MQGGRDAGAADRTGHARAAAPCYCAGTLVLTDRGEVPVERLAIGDRVVTASGAVRPVRWIGRRSYAGPFASGNPDVLPVVFRAGSLGDGLPRRDLWVSPPHAMFLDGALIPARLLVNGVSIVRAQRAERVDYLHVELDGHDLLLAEGAAAESFVDADSRGMFQNAWEYELLYPGARPGPAQPCAPRVEDGERLAAVRRRLDGLAAPPAGGGTMRGYLDHADRDVVRGWARDTEAPGTRVRLLVAADGALLGEVLADEERADLHALAEGDGRHAFHFTIPGGLAADRRHVIEVVREEDGQPLTNSPMVVEPALPLPPAAPAAAVPFAGVLDRCDRERVAGWAWQPGTDAPVALQVLDNGVPLVRVLANLRRADARRAGLPGGCHGFDLMVPGGLSPLSRHVIEIRREPDGAALPGTPVVIEPADGLGPAADDAVAQALASLKAQAEEYRVLSFLLARTERLRRRRAVAEGGASRKAVADDQPG